MAALLVVYYHSVLQLPHLWVGDPWEPRPAIDLPLLGKSGVDIFFVLSGLLIWSSTAESRQTLFTFYSKRLLRIAPLYWLLTLATATVALLVPWALNSTKFDPAHVVASLLFIPWPNPASHGSPQDLMTPPIVPGWTLNFEIFFYVVFGPCLLAPRAWRLPAALLLFGLAMIGIRLLGPDVPGIAFYDPGLILEFVIGLCLGVLFSKELRMPAPSAWLLLAASVDLLLLLDWDGLGVHRLFTSGIPAGLLLISLVSLEARGRWPQLPWLVLLGDATYSLYLTHIFVLAGLRMVLNRLGATPDTWPAQVAFVSLAAVLCIAIGIATYHFIERPLGHALRNAGLLRPGKARPVEMAGRMSGR